MEVGPPGAKGSQLPGEVGGEDAEDAAAHPSVRILVWCFDVPVQDPRVQSRRLRPDRRESIRIDVLEAGQRPWATYPVGEEDAVQHLLARRSFVDEEVERSALHR